MFAIFLHYWLSVHQTNATNYIWHSQREKGKQFSINYMGFRQKRWDNWRGQLSRFVKLWWKPLTEIDILQIIWDASVNSHSKYQSTLSSRGPHSHCPLSVGILHQFHTPSSVAKFQMWREGIFRCASDAPLEVVSEVQHWGTEPVWREPAAWSRGVSAWWCLQCRNYTGPSLSKIKRKEPQSNGTGPNSSNVVTGTVFGNLNIWRKSVCPTDSLSHYCKENIVCPWQKKTTTPCLCLLPLLCCCS